MTPPEETDELLRKLAGGDPSVGSQLLRRHRARLTRMVAMRLDRRLSARFDPSDVVQEALVIANNRLVTYAQEQRIPFYPWLRRIAWEQLIKFHQRHLQAQKRAIVREQQYEPQLNDESVDVLVNRLACGEESPSEQLIKLEQKAKVRKALESLNPRNREIIELRYLEHLEVGEIAAVLDIREAAVRTRHFRAIQRLHQVLQGGTQI